ncbi:hypothetical protein ABPG74_017873 [Tetrahymena malaccensis]
MSEHSSCSCEELECRAGFMSTQNKMETMKISSQKQLHSEWIKRVKVVLLYLHHFTSDVQGVRQSTTSYGYTYLHHIQTFTSSSDSFLKRLKLLWIQFYLLKFKLIYSSFLFVPSKRESQIQIFKMQLKLILNPYQLNSRQEVAFDCVTICIRITYTKGMLRGSHLVFKPIQKRVHMGSYKYIINSCDSRCFLSQFSY